MRAARTERDLESHRFEGPLAAELARGRAVAAGEAPTPAPAASPAPSVALWRHSTATHTIWCERDASGREVVRVARLASGEVIAEFS